MALNIETFSNAKGGNSLFKILGHPLAAGKAPAFLERLRAAGRLAVYDPSAQAATFAELYDLSALEIACVFVQDVDDLGKEVLGCISQPVTELKAADVAAVFVAAFDAERSIQHIRHLVPEGAEVLSLDALRLPDDMLTNARHYLDPLNVATNFAFFRDTGGHHSRIVTANYWTGYGAENPSLWLCLFDEAGEILAQWREKLGETAGSIVIDSREVRKRFGLGPFTGQLFMHVVGAAGHDVVKYALDTYGEEETVLSCTHDANAWPADLYAGLPAPGPGERVVLWVQNSHPCPIPPHGVGLNLMGSSEIHWLDQPIAPFGTYALDVSELVPEAAWPDQFEIQAGKYFVRPRYEVFAGDGRQRIAHVNVERTDLEPDPRIAELGNLLGKGYLLPAPILPPERWRALILPTPMATSQEELSLALHLYDASGREVAARPLGRLARRDSVALDIDQMLAENGGLASGYGHMELVYDFSNGGAADGWLHAIFRYQDRASGHVAETSFGSHIFNTVLTYGSEPQSYGGRPPGLSTRLFLRLGAPPLETLCHLIYPASAPWHARSATELILFDRRGAEVARKRVEIPLSGSLLWRYSEMFEADARRRAGDDAYLIVRDQTCRLFGYHGLLNGEAAFSFDHMFGF